MSTTRWIWWCEIHKGGHEDLTDCWGAGLDGVDNCEPSWVKRIVVDPDNLPPGAIQRAAKAIAKERGHAETKGYTVGDTLDAAAAVRAFLSDPEQGDQ